MSKRETQSFEDAYINLERERELLRYLAIKDASLLIHTDERLFVGEHHQRIYRILLQIKSHVPAGAVMDIVMRHVRGGGSIVQDIRDTVGMITESSDLKTFGAARETLDYLRELFSQREVTKVALEAESMVREGKTEDAFKALRTLSISDLSRVHTGEYLEDFENRLTYQSERRKGKHGKELIRTGLRKFDQLTGGIKKGELGVVIGETGGGKSTFKMNVATYAWAVERCNVVYLGLEMSVQENQFRVDSFLTSIAANSFRQARLSQEDLARWEKTIKELKANIRTYFEFVSARNMKMSEILTLVESIESKKGKVDLVVLDHLMLVKGEDRRQDQKDRLLEHADSLTQWAGQRNVAVWTSGQLDEDGMTRKRKGKLQASNIKYGKGVSEFAQIVLGLYETDANHVASELTLQGLKGRNIQRGFEITLHPDLDSFIVDKLSYYNVAMEVSKDLKQKLGKKKKQSKK